MSAVHGDTRNVFQRAYMRFRFLPRRVCVCVSFAHSHGPRWIEHTTLNKEIVKRVSQSIPISHLYTALHTHTPIHLYIHMNIGYDYIHKATIHFWSIRRAEEMNAK